MIDKKYEDHKAKNNREENLARAFLSLKTERDVLDFLRDLFTLPEIEEFANRLEIARLLEFTDLSYQEIAKKVGTSTTTVTRVAMWLNNGCGGYKTVLKRLKK